MSFVQNFPFFSIVLSMFTGIISSVLKGKWARNLLICTLSLIAVMSAFVTVFCATTGESYTYMMGHYPAPWGNEIRAGVLEGVMAFFFSIIMLLCLFGGMRHTENELESSKLNFFYLLLSLLMSSLLALVYTNDMFTAYVFVEINTLAACGLIIIRYKGHTLVAGIRYMIMSLIGSGLFLIGLCMLYDVTGHLLMSDMKEAVSIIVQDHSYDVPMTVIIGLMCVGLSIKSALFPFHSWVPDTYGYSTSTAAAVLSSLVSKGYIFLLIKIMYRVIGIDVVRKSNVLLIFFVFGVIAMIVGSVNAIKTRDIRRMIAYSSVAQIGYIYMGIGMATPAGMIAAIMHIMVHSATKALLFVSAAELSAVSGGSKRFEDLSGAGYRNPVAGYTFAVGCLSMVGIPAFAGFITKLLFATAGLQSQKHIWVVLIALCVSTILNTMYFLRTLLRIFTKTDTHKSDKKNADKSFRFTATCVVFIALNFILGLCSQPIISLVEKGIAMFA